MKTNYYKVIFCILTVMITFLAIIISTEPVYAEKMVILTPRRYEDESGTGFMIAEDHKVSTYSYGADSIGKFRMDGTFKEQTEHKGFIAYNATGEINFTFDYNGSYQTTNKEEWNLKKSSEKSINGYKITKDSIGTILVQASKTGNDSDWNTVFEMKNVFTRDNKDRLYYYKVSENDLKSGTYYRAMVAYEIQKQIGTKGLFKSPVYESKECLEVYEFYLGYSDNPVKLRDLYTGSEILDTKNISGGFIVDKGGSDYQVSVKKGNQKEQIVEDMTTFCEPGTYTVTVQSDLKQSYQFTAKVKDGVTMESLTPKTYDNGKNGKYTEDGLISDVASFGEKNLTTLKIAQESGNKIKRTTKSNFEAFGMTGSTVQLYMQLHNPQNQEWHFNPDNWGHREREKVNGRYTGTVNTGALLIQKSSDGNNWTTVDNEQYANHLSTTDYSQYYADKGDVLIYTPDGNEILNGLYLKVTYAYQLKKGGRDTARYMEVYQVYLCSDNLDAVTFHNLSATEQLSTIITNFNKNNDDADVNVEVYKKAESLQSGSCTVSGFEIDTSLNPTVCCNVYKDGNAFTVPNDNRVIETGKYKIELKSAVGSTKNVTIYVDRMNAGQAAKAYFGSGFLSGKRVYSDGNVPTYEGGLTTYRVCNPGDQFLPITGTIKNIDTNKEIKIDGKLQETEGKLTEPGNYVATFQTLPSNTSIPGDYRKFTYSFEIIRKGTSPGPVCNQRNLAKYAQSSMSDSYPRFFGVTYVSAGKGDITLAFNTKEAAKEYAKKYENGLVELQPDGTYRYKGAFMTDQKVKYESNWDLQDAIDFTAEQCVHEHYFDLSDPFTYLTLNKNLIEKTDNLRTLELEKSITIFAEGEREKLCSRDGLPVISRKPFSYLSAGMDGKVTNGFNDFQFIKDKRGYDSASVTIIDKNGKTYPMDYRKNVGETLENLGCPSGIITIKEMNRYNDPESYEYDEPVTYEAVFIKEGENTAVTSIAVQSNGNKQTQTFTQNNCKTERTVKAQSFKIEEVKDELDPYTLIAVTHRNKKDYYVADQLPKESFTESGEYTISIINRLGYSYSFKIIVG